MFSNKEASLIHLICSTFLKDKSRKKNTNSESQSSIYEFITTHEGMSKYAMNEYFEHSLKKEFSKEDIYEEKFNLVLLQEFWYKQLSPRKSTKYYADVVLKERGMHEPFANLTKEQIATLEAYSTAF